VRRGYGTIFALALVLAACGSGPSDTALEHNQPPPTTTTTTLPPEGMAVVTISNAKFAPALLQLDLTTTWLVRWVNQDPPREYVLSINGIFESPLLAPGDSFEFDFSTLEPAIYRYNTYLGNQRIPGMIDTRPER
jgi:hypothetical protein